MRAALLLAFVLMFSSALAQSKPDCPAGIAPHRRGCATDKDCGGLNEHNLVCDGATTESLGTCMCPKGMDCEAVSNSSNSIAQFGLCEEDGQCAGFGMVDANTTCAERMFCVASADKTLTKHCNTCSMCMQRNALEKTTYDCTKACSGKYPELEKDSSDEDEKKENDKESSGSSIMLSGCVYATILLCSLMF